MKTKTILLFTLAILAITGNTMAQNVPSYIPTNGLVGWWPFNGNANDESGNGNDGTVSGPNLTNDRFGNTEKAFVFDGLDDFISFLNYPLISFPLTISTWIKLDNLLGAHQPILGLGEFGSSDFHKLYFSPNYGGIGRPSIGIGGTNDITSSNTIIPSELWTHLAVCIYTYSPSDVVFFVNGVSFNTNTSGGSNNPFPLNSSGFVIGKHSVSYGASYFDGIIDDIAIWNRALTQEEITALFTASNNNETSNTTANVPGAISYQAVARDAQGMPLADANLQVQFTLIADSLSGTAEYIETHTLTTNSLGLFTTALGAGTPVSNTFGNINWSAGHKFLQVQIDAGNGWMDMGTQQLLSTPYSMHSATSGAIKNPGLPVFADNAAALAGGLVAGDMYRTASGDLKIVY